MVEERDKDQIHEEFKRAPFGDTKWRSSHNSQYFRRFSEKFSHAFFCFQKLFNNVKRVGKVRVKKSPLTFRTTQTQYK